MAVRETAPSPPSCTGTASWPRARPSTAPCSRPVPASSVPTPARGDQPRQPGPGARQEAPALINRRWRLGPGPPVSRQASFCTVADSSVWMVASAGSRFTAAYSSLTAACSSPWAARAWPIASSRRAPTCARGPPRKAGPPRGSTPPRRQGRHVRRPGCRAATRPGRAAAGRSPARTAGPSRRTARPGRVRRRSVPARRRAGTCRVSGFGRVCRCGPQRPTMRSLISRYWRGTPSRAVPSLSARSRYLSSRERAAVAGTLAGGGAVAKSPTAVMHVSMSQVRSQSTGIPCTSATAAMAAPQKPDSAASTTSGKRRRSRRRVTRLDRARSDSHSRTQAACSRAGSTWSATISRWLPSALTMRLVRTA